MKTSFLSPEDIAAGEKALAEICERNRHKAAGHREVIGQVNGKQPEHNAWDSPDWQFWMTGAASYPIFQPMFSHQLGENG